MEPGVEATLADLAWNLQLEGKTVRLEGWDEGRARWNATLLDGTCRRVRVVAWNLEATQGPLEGGWRAGDAAVLQGLQTQKGWNGRSVLLLEPDRQAGKWLVRCPGGTSVRVATGNLGRPRRDETPRDRGFQEVSDHPGVYKTRGGGLDDQTMDRERMSKGKRLRGGGRWSALWDPSPKPGDGR